MKILIVLRNVVSLLAIATTLCAALPPDEAGTIAYLCDRDVETTKNADGKITNLEANEAPPFTLFPYQPLQP